MKLTVVYEAADQPVIARADDGQLFIGGTNEDGTRVFQKIQAYSLRFNGGEELDSYVLEDGSRVFTLDEPQFV